MEVILRLMNVSMANVSNCRMRRRIALILTPHFTLPSKAGLVTLPSGAHFATTQEVYSRNIVFISLLPSYHDAQQEPASIPCVSAVSPEEAQMRSVSPSIRSFTSRNNPLIDYFNSSSPKENQSSCFECLRTGDECKPAGSRRGGNFAHLRRTKQSSNKPVSRTATSAQDLESTGSLHSTGDRNSADKNRSHALESTYAELKNPCDALQILANIATTNTHSTVTETTSPNGVCSNISADGVDLPNYTGLDNDSPTMYSTPGSLLPRSETEKLVNDGLGVSKALKLLYL